MPVQPTTLLATNYTGVSKAIFTAIGGSKAKTLSGRNASIFLTVNEAFKDINPSENLTFGQILKSLYELLPDVLKIGVVGGARLLKNIATAIRNFFVKENKASGTNPAVTTTDVVTSAESYYGVINSPSQGNVFFSNGRKENWCADTVTFICKDLYGDKLPKDFGTASVYNMREWGKAHNLYTETSTLSKKARQEWITNNVKPGDIFVIKRNGGSHVGIVTRVYEQDGQVKFDSAEGNWGQKFNKVTRTSEDNTLSGFISMQQYIDEATVKKLEISADEIVPESHNITFNNPAIQPLSISY